MRYLGLDLGTKSLGISMTDKTNTLVSPFKVVKFPSEKYEFAKEEVLKIMADFEISKVVLGLPKNMDGSIGFAGKRSLLFKEMLESVGVVVELEDERLTTKMGENIVHDNMDNVKNTKNKIDAIAACIILESYLKRCKNDTQK